MGSKFAVSLMIKINQRYDRLHFHSYAFMFRNWTFDVGEVNEIQTMYMYLYKFSIEIQTKRTFDITYE